MTKTQSVSFSVDTTDARKTMAALDEAARGDLMKQVEGALSESGRVLAEKVRVAVRKIPSWGMYGTSIRSTIAGNVESRSSLGSGGAWVRIEVNPVGLPPGLAAAMDTDKKRPVPGHGTRFAFRHPVFGNRERWANQAGAPYFRRTLRNQKRVVDRSLRAVMEKYGDEIASRG